MADGTVNHIALARYYHKAFSQQGLATQAHLIIQKLCTWGAEAS